MMAMSVNMHNKDDEADAEALICFFYVVCNLVVTYIDAIEVMEGEGKR